MSENTDVKQNYEEVEIEKEYIEMIEKAENASKMTKSEFDKFYKEAEESINFLKLIDNIKIPNEKIVIYTDGQEQVIYENGEFFVVSTFDSTSPKRKITRKDAINNYIEFFIKYQINPIIKIKKEMELNKKIKSRTKNISRNKKELKIEDIIKNEEKKDKELKENEEKKVKEIKKEKEVKKKEELKKVVREHEL